MPINSNNAVTTLIGVAFTGAITWFSTVTKMGFDNKAKLLVLDERTLNMEKQITNMDSKLDLLLGGPQQQASRAEERQ